MRVNSNVIISLKWVSTIIIVMGMIYSPTYYIDEPNMSQGAWIWGGVLLFAIWTKKDRPIIKSIASFMPIVFLGMSLMLLNPTMWMYFIGLVLFSILLLLAIWQKNPQKESAVISDSEFYKSRSDDQIKSSNNVQTCFKCNNVLREGQNFCPKCGEDISSNLCKDCGFENVDKFEFCPKCGTKF